MKKICLFLLCLLMCLTPVGCNNKPDIASSDTTANETTTDEIPTNISYQSVTLKDMYQIYDQNRARFEAQYKDQYLSITGEISYITSDDSFAINQYVYDYAGNRIAKYVTASANVKNDSLKALVLEFNEGDTVTIMGKVVEFSYGIGCIVELDVYDFIIN